MCLKHLLIISVYYVFHTFVLFLFVVYHIIIELILCVVTCNILINSFECMHNNIGRVNTSPLIIYCTDNYFFCTLLSVNIISYNIVVLLNDNVHYYISNPLKLSR